MLIKIIEANGKHETKALLDCNYIGKTHDGYLKLIPKGDKFKFVTIICITDNELEQILNTCESQSILDLTKYIFTKERYV